MNVYVCVCEYYARVPVWQYVCVFAWNIQHFVFARECQTRQKDGHRTLVNSMLDSCI